MKQYHHETVFNEGLFDPDSFRTKVIDQHRIITGCPKGKYNKRTGKCKVGTRAQAILHPKDKRHESNPVCNLKETVDQTLNWSGADVARLIRFKMPTITGYSIHVGQLHQIKYLNPRGKGKKHDFKKTQVFSQANADWIIISGNFKFDPERGFVNK